MCNLLSLPNELINEIFYHLSFKDKQRFKFLSCGCYNLYWNYVRKKRYLHPIEDLFINHEDKDLERINKDLERIPGIIVGITEFDYPQCIILDFNDFEFSIVVEPIIYESKSAIDDYPFHQVCIYFVNRKLFALCDVPDYIECININFNVKIAKSFDRGFVVGVKSNYEIKYDGRIICSLIVGCEHFIIHKTRR